MLSRVNHARIENKGDGLRWVCLCAEVSLTNSFPLLIIMRFRFFSVGLSMMSLKHVEMMTLVCVTCQRESAQESSVAAPAQLGITYLFFASVGSELI